MPELPEVETIRRGLEKKIIGLTLEKVTILTPKIFQGDPQKLQGNNVLNVWRRAKILGINLGCSSQSSAISHQTKKQKSLKVEDCVLITLLFHLKMTGQLIFIKGGEKIIGGHPTENMKGQMPNSSTRVIFEFSDGSKLYFNDQRKFGWVKLVNSSEFMVHGEKILGKLGPEPFDKKFTWEILKENLLKHKSLPIKVALMDQSTVAGIGNIYASESLFLAKIDPRRKVVSLSDEEFKKLYRGIKESLETAIRAGGSTRAHFVNVDGERGYFLDYANVYGKEGQACKARLPGGQGCPGKVQKITQAGRGTYFCPSCQK